MAFGGIDVRRTTDEIVSRIALLDQFGDKVTAGNVFLLFYELQTDGSLKAYDFNDKAFKTTQLTTPSGAMTHRTVNSSTVNTGVWTHVLTHGSGFAYGGNYIAEIVASGASPTNIYHQWQYGGVQGDPEFLVSTVNDGSPASGLFQATSADVTLSSANDFYNLAAVVFISGGLRGIANKVYDYTGATNKFTFTPAFPAAPASGDKFLIIGHIE